jgi:ring-1,2-phenylacetyl-CoA epoxidase subunit PaaD
MVIPRTAATIEQVWSWLEQVPDPEIPVLSVVDLGIVRDVAWASDDEEDLVVTITPTYSGCPATQVIAADIERTLRSQGIERLHIKTQIAPPWTTDWISTSGRDKLRRYGIAPPQRRRDPVACPRCGSASTVRVSEFGSTPCKALYKCQDCLEPFDYFKCL